MCIHSMFPFIKQLHGIMLIEVGRNNYLLALYTMRKLTLRDVQWFAQGLPQFGLA